MTFGILVLSFHNVEKELKAVSKRRETVAARFMKSINNCTVFHRVEKRKKRKKTELQMLSLRHEMSERVSQYKTVHWAIKPSNTRTDLEIGHESKTARPVQLCLFAPICTL